MLKRALSLVSLIVILTAMFGCGGPKPATEPLEAPGDLAYEQIKTKERFRKYKSVGIRIFRTDDVVYLSTEGPEEEREMDMFTKTAGEYIAKGFVSEMKDNYYPEYGIIDNDDDLDKYDLVIDGAVMELDRGNAAGRFWGVGGAARVSVKGTMTETATGNVVVNFNDAKIDARNLGSEYLMGNICEEIGGNLSDFLEEVY